MIRFHNCKAHIHNDLPESQISVNISYTLLKFTLLSKLNPPITKLESSPPFASFTKTSAQNDPSAVDVVANWFKDDPMSQRGCKHGTPAKDQAANVCDTSTRPVSWPDCPIWHFF